MWQHVDDGEQLLDTSAWRTRRVQDDGVTSNSCDPSRQTTEWIHETHRFCEAGSFAVNDESRTLWRLVTWREAGASCRHDHTTEVTTEIDEGLGDHFPAVATHAVFDDLCTMGDQCVTQCATRRVFARSSHDAITHCQHLRAERTLSHVTNRTGGRRPSSQRHWEREM